MGGFRRPRPNRSPVRADGEEARQCERCGKTKASGSRGRWPPHACREVCPEPIGGLPPHPRDALRVSPDPTPTLPAAAQSPGEGFPEKAGT